MQRLLAALALCAALSAPAEAAAPRTIAIFNLDLVNTSPAASTPEELSRLRTLDHQLRQDLARSGPFTPVDLAPLRAKLAHIGPIRSCNRCELDLARQVGAELAAYGWVQKVSNLILNINLVIEDAATGHILHADSVDIRGNTDESWRRGLTYLLHERMFRH